ncbi:fructokinase [Clostridia bacterium]|nr:fructokinase [Clostridia bacterium]
MANKIIIGLGEILWDMLPTGKVLGGAPANFAYHASQFGYEGIAVSAIGKDTLGTEILDNLTGKKMKTLLEAVDYPTGTVAVTLDEKGVPQYEICEGAAWDNIPFTAQTEELAKRCVAVCFGSLAQRSIVSRLTIHKFLEYVPADALKIFDINLRQHFYSKEIIVESLKNCNILKINDDEVKIVAELFGIEGEEDAVCKKILKEYGLQMVIETKGAVGSYVFTANETSYVPTPKVQVTDTIGAGDSFTGAFVASLLDGKSIPEAHAKAVEISAWVCTQQGAMPAYENISKI